MTIELPPLPNPRISDYPRAYSDEQMLNYARLAVEQDRATSSTPPADLRRLVAERDALWKAAECAVHDMEKARVWNGMDWHYNPLHPLNYRSALENLRTAIDAAKKNP